jgi:hypothetical protein
VSRTVRPSTQISYRMQYHYCDTSDGFSRRRPAAGRCLRDTKGQTARLPAGHTTEPMLGAAMMSAETFVFPHGPADQKVVEMAEDWVQPAWTAIAISKDDSLARTHACAVRQLQEGTFRKMNGVLSK